MTAPSTLSLLVLALCLCTGLCTDSPKADDGYEVFPAFPWSRYKMPPFSLNWTEAVASCESEGGGSTLVVINSDEEAKVVGELVRRLDWNVQGYPWVGINDIETEGRWVTAQGGLVAASGYDRWISGSPSGSRNYNCGHVHDDSLYDDYPCSSDTPFICEKPNV